jgi:membrane protein implicated in regulation of membrane protease activity
MIPLAPGFGWLAGGLLLMVAEAFAPGAFMVWIGLAALGAGLITLWLDLPFALEVVAFAAFAALTVMLGLRLRRPRAMARMNTATAGLVGRTAQALAANGPDLRVRVGDSDWPARLAAGFAATAPGDALEVIGVDGMTLVVQPRHARTTTPPV